MADQIKFLGQITPSSDNMGAGDKFVGVRGSNDLLFTPAQVAAAVGGGGGTTAVGVPLFATPADAQAAAISDAVVNLAVTGNKTSSDGGAANYKRVSSLPSLYVGDGTVRPLIPPNFTSGGIPVTCFVTTADTAENHSYIFRLDQPILAGCFTFITITFPNVVGSLFPTSVTDSVGNTYTAAVTLESGGIGLLAIYYNSNPVFAAAGATINLGGFNPAMSGNNPQLNVYCCPTFKGAVLDKIATGGFGPGVQPTVTTAALTGSPAFAVGMTFTNNVWFNGTSLIYTPPSGWIDLEPQIIGRDAVCCTVVNSTNPVTFAPILNTSTAPNGSFVAVAVFKTFPATALDVSYWQQLPSLPYHTAQFGIDPNTADNVAPFRNFSNYLATLATPSGGMGAERAGTPNTGTVTISIANPAVITVATPPQIPGGHGLRSGQAISFQTTGQLPTGIIPNQIYYIQYGSVTSTTFQISTTSIFDATGTQGGQQTVAKGTPIATSGSQSGVHSYTTYGQSWMDFVVDPGVYYASQNQVPGLGVGLQKWRLFGYGARFATNANFAAAATNDINANTGGSTFAYTAQFNSTTESHTSGNFNNYVILSTPAQSSNFRVNGWVILMCINQQSSADGNWNPAIFEFAKIKSIDAGTGTITFWDYLQHNYRSTYPRFLSPSNAITGASDGPGTIVQLTDVFDQEIEVHGLNMYGVTEGSCGGVLSLRFIDCDVFGWGFDSGPSPVNLRRFSMENCKLHNCVPEIDKMIDFMLYRDCDFDQTSYLRFQSASINKVVVDRCKMMGGLSGTPKDLTIRDSFIGGSFTYGPVYGSTQRMTLINTHVERIINNDQASETIQTAFPGMSFVNGTIKIASGTVHTYGTWAINSVSAACPAPWAQPGAKILVEFAPFNSTGGAVDPTAGGGTCGMMTCFTVLDVYTDGAGAFCIDTDMPALPNTAITVTGTVSGTTLTVTAVSPSDAYLLRGAFITGGGLPANTYVTADNGGMPGVNTGTFTLNNSATIGTPTPFTATSAMNYLPHPCPRLTMVNCTGSRFASDMAGAPPDIPMFSYFKRAYSGGTLLVTTREKDLYLAGKLLTWTINVIKPYTGAGANYVCAFDVGGFKTSGGITYPTYINQSVDLKTPGLRTITAAGVTGNVGADSLQAIPFWISGTHFVVIGISPSFIPNGADTLAQMPFFIMTAQTDQGIGFSSMVTVTAKSGADMFADTTTQAAQQGP